PLEPLADLDAVDLRHHDVEQDQVRLGLIGRRQRLGAVGCGDDLVAVGRQTGPHDPEVGRVVVGDQDAWRSPHSASYRVTTIFFELSHPAGWGGSETARRLPLSSSAIVNTAFG